MNCKKAQRLVDDLAKNRLPDSLAEQVRQHLTDCTDCRVVQQRAARLLRLVALKRYERPAPEYFAGFLDEFHRRQQAELSQWSGLWEKIMGGLTVEPVRVWRVGFASALGVALAAGVMWIGVRQQNQSPEIAGHQAKARNSPKILTEAPGAVRDPDSDRVRLTLPLSDEPPVAAGFVLGPQDAQVEPAEPGYVLDRITVTPASYEVASVRF